MYTTASTPNNTTHNVRPIQYKVQQMKFERTQEAKKKKLNDSLTHSESLDVLLFLFYFIVFHKYSDNLSRIPYNMEMDNFLFCDAISCVIHALN